MKRSIILKILAFCLLGLYFAALAVWFVIYGAIFPQWFSLGALFLGLWLVTKSYYFVLDSALFLGLALCFCGMIGTLQNIFVSIKPHIAAIYILALAFAALCTAVFYKKHSQYKIFFILILEDFFVLLYSYSVINLLWLLILNALSVILICGGQYVFNRKRRL